MRLATIQRSSNQAGTSHYHIIDWYAPVIGFDQYQTNKALPHTPPTSYAVTVFSKLVSTPRSTPDVFLPNPFLLDILCRRRELRPSATTSPNMPSPANPALLTRLSTHRHFISHSLPVTGSLKPRDVTQTHTQSFTSIPLFTNAYGDVATETPTTPLPPKNPKVIYWRKRRQCTRKKEIAGLPCSYTLATRKNKDDRKESRCKPALNLFPSDTPDVGERSLSPYQR